MSLIAGITGENANKMGHILSVPGVEADHKEYRPLSLQMRNRSGDEISE
jgi:hypothetical protein